ncbi:hypothetical protein CSUI_002387 [Cystoisospora suis]|uniref:Uncharacterized protein n=1 Tax=Cystoisospora suis TaxID=483139 RepID=A0A2C6L8Z9_9APIC|nr:hypothetical protein CSUI_002387 [Cystoisospora suis]
MKIERKRKEDLCRRRKTSGAVHLGDSHFFKPPKQFLCQPILLFFRSPPLSFLLPAI